MRDRSLTYSIIWYGCQMNEHDAEMMDGLLSSRGWHRVNNEQDADIIIINTCSVRQTAEDRALRHLSSFKPHKDKNPNKIIILSGCIAQKDGISLMDKFPFLDIIVGTRDFLDLPRLIDQGQHYRQPIIAIDNWNSPVLMEAPAKRTNPVKAMINIMFGCNNHCAFCIVPQTRGQEVCRPLNLIVKEIEDLVKNDYKEVFLLGQNVNSWKDENEKKDFSDLLIAINDINGIQRIRYTTSNPKDASHKLIETVASCSKVCENFHLPLQSGSDKILNLMKRSYTRDLYLRLIDKIRCLIPNAVITTDIIVGFPGEEECDFQQTLDLVNQVQFDGAFMFAYSPRPGTYAYSNLPDTVLLDVKKRRLQCLIDNQEQISSKKNMAMIGSKVEVLVEGKARRYAHQMMGRTRGDKIAVFPGSHDLIGQLIDITLTQSTAHTLIGEIIR